MSVQPHLHRVVVHAFERGEVEDAAALEAIAEHLAECPQCESAFDALARHEADTSGLRPNARQDAAASLDTDRQSIAVTVPVVERPTLADLPDPLLEHPKWKWLGLLGSGGNG